ncbi:hypothetical protein [Nonomuraea sp. NPDC050691]|uniref:hypothetical protein n=1 Tax=Nonomuraea sp. NPDC050691 TaxID=3155661 RepID=UPI0033FF950F
MTPASLLFVTHAGAKSGEAAVPVLDDVRRIIGEPHKRAARAAPPSSKTGRS